MSRYVRAGAILAIVVASIAVHSVRAPSASARARERGSVSIVLDRAQVATRIGHRFEFTSTIRNGDRLLREPVAHLNVLSLEPDVYVDPEDWSSHRTVYLTTLAAHGSTTIRWDVQAVNEVASCCTSRSARIARATRSR